MTTLIHDDTNATTKIRIDMHSEKNTHICARLLAAAEAGKDGVAIAAAELADGCSLLKLFCLFGECRKRPPADSRIGGSAQSYQSLYIS